VADLSNWNIAVDFTGEEAAALALGIDPSKPGYTSSVVKPLITRMQFSYQKKIDFQLHDPDLEVEDSSLHNWTDDFDASHMLISVEHQKMLDAFGWDEVGPYSSWIANARLSSFNRQRFSREELTRWFNAIGYKSLYSFDCSYLVPKTADPIKWPWGNHQTKALEHLAEAAQKFWSTYDPSDPYSAPKNETVVRWLTTEREVSEVMAKSIASMLRPDNLPTGPRKRK